jgi:hypothetical protein
MVIGISGGQNHCIAYARCRYSGSRNPFNIRAENKEMAVEIQGNREKY